MTNLAMMTIQTIITAQDERFMELFHRQDAAGLAAMYTVDGQLLPPNADFMVGREAIQAFWQGGMDMGLKEAKIEIVEVEQVDNTAIEMSRYTLYGAERQLIDQGKFIVIWKYVDGQWMLHRDIFNSSVALPT